MDRYICQLGDGWMLKRTENAYKVEHTGYPYRDTLLPSREGLANLFCAFDTAKRNDVYNNTSKYMDKVRGLFGGDTGLELSLSDIVGKARMRYAKKVLNLDGRHDGAVSLCYFGDKCDMGFAETLCDAVYKVEEPEYLFLIMSQDSYLIKRFWVQRHRACKGWVYGLCIEANEIC